MTDKNAIIEGLDQGKMYFEAYKLENCMKTGIVIHCDTCGKQFYVPLRCDLRICSDCSRKHSRRLLKKYLPLIQKLGEVRGSSYTLKFLTLTVVNTRELSNESIKALFKNVRKLIREFFDKKMGAGALGVLEVGKNLNIHIHLLAYGPYVLQQRLSERWAEITGDSFIVDIRKARGNHQNLLNYVLKYITKPCSFEEPKHYAQYLMALKGVRRVHSFGIFYNIGKVIKELIRCACGGRLKFDRSFYRENGRPSILSLRWPYGIPPISEAIRAENTM
jgi:hypothetical protein